jgi:hypothetical protein
MVLKMKRRVLLEKERDKLKKLLARMNCRSEISIKKRYNMREQETSIVDNIYASQVWPGTGKH